MPIDTDEIVITKEDTLDERDLPWNVVVFDDPVNLMSFVTLILRRIFGYSEEKAQELMLQVHNSGRSIVWTGAREQAELYVQQLQSHQLNASMEQIDG
ncbi:MAG: ATP-dependent Clp protease adapter ClpS [Verrucomicrobiota bacterium]